MAGGNYRVTYADGEHLRSWEVRNSKVTSEPEKGYYFFWVDAGARRYYVQTPIARTHIEEIPWPLYCMNGSIIRTIAQDAQPDLA